MQKNINIIDLVVKEAKWVDSSVHSYACLMVDLHPTLKRKMGEIADEIPEEVLCPEDGVEERRHITVLYGLQDSDADCISQPGPVWMENDSKVSYFDNMEKGQSVAIVKIKSPDLHRIHYALDAQFPDNANSFPEYEPHATIAYLRYGHRLGDYEIPVTRWEVREFVLSKTDGNEQKISISGMIKE